MIDREKVQMFVDEVAARPFRVDFVSGRTLDVIALDRVEVDRSTMTVYRTVNAADGTREIAFMEVSYLGIESVAPVDACEIFGMKR